MNQLVNIIIPFIKYQKMFSVVILIFLSSKCVIAANILYVAPLPSPSHHIWNRVLALELAKKGYNVTHIAPDLESSKIENYSHILLEGIYEELSNNFDFNQWVSVGPTRLLIEMHKYYVLCCKTYAESNGLQKLLSYPEDFFDLIIFDVSGGTCLYPLIEKFNYPPAVAVVPFLLPANVANNFGNPLYPSHLPWYGLRYSQDMSFFERVWNFIYTYTDVIVQHPRQQKDIEHIITAKFADKTAEFDEIERHISLVLANTNPILDYPQPLIPNIIPVGGLHTKNPEKLPQDLQIVLDNAKNGAIIISFGTNVRSDKLDKNIQNILLDAFSKIPESIIWKFESEISNLPENVFVRKFLPQNDLLGHPNVKLFIGHGGALSTQEAIFHGVPMICVPFYMDQHTNSRNIVDRELGILMDFTNISTNYVIETLREALDNPLYAQNMKKVSLRFRDQVQTPLEKGIFWIEYALRHNGTQFLNTRARDLPVYISSSIDVVAFLFSTTFFLFILMYKILTLLVEYSKQNKNKTKVH